MLHLLHFTCCLAVCSLALCAAEVSSHFNAIRIESAAKGSDRGYVEYGTTKNCEQQTPETEKMFYNQDHWIEPLTEGATYFYRLVSTNANGHALMSKIAEFTTASSKKRIAHKSIGKTITLDQTEMQ